MIVWDRFIASVDNDVHGYQMIVYKLLKHLNDVERDRAHLNIVTEIQWIERFSNLRVGPVKKKFIVNKVGIPPKVDPITIEEIETELKKLKNGKAVGLDGINSELLKYGVERI